MGNVSADTVGNLSHAQRDSTFEEAVNRIVDKVKARGDLPYVSVARQLELITQLSEFDLGRFLLERGGLNGYWTHYLVTYPENDRNLPSNVLEAFMLKQAPTALATQQRFTIFKREIQARLHEGISLASIPCGLMSDLLDLDFSQASTFSLTGIDLDPESISLCKQMAEERGLAKHCEFYERNAWELNVHEEFDLITSNGLAMYEPDEERVIALYREFFKSLKPGGWLITSFLTPPPWKADAVNFQDALLQKILFADILDCKWQTFRSEVSVKSQLDRAGFVDIEIVYDAAHIFPTIIGQKPK